MAARLMHQHHTIRDLTAGLPDETLATPSCPANGASSKTSLTSRAYQPVFISRLERISREPSPVFDRYVAEQDPHFPSYLDRSFEALLGNIDATAHRYSLHAQRWRRNPAQKTASIPAMAC